MRRTYPRTSRMSDRNREYRRITPNYDKKASRQAHRSDRRDYEYDNEYDYDEYDDNVYYDRDYREDLKNWARKLKKHDRFNLEENEIINQAHNMGVTFKDFDELEFLTTYYMMISDYPEIANSPQTYMAMAKSFLCDDDIEVSPSEKLEIYMYEIVMGE